MRILIALACLLPALAFAAEAQIQANGSVELQWEPPTENVDGTPLTDLAGFRIYWGTEPGNYTNSLPIDDAGRTSATVQLQVSQAVTTFYFAMTALDDDGNESAFSNEVARTVTIEVDDTTPPAIPILRSIEFTLDGCIVVDDPSAECRVTVE